MLGVLYHVQPFWGLSECGLCNCREMSLESGAVSKRTADPCGPLSGTALLLSLQLAFTMKTWKIWLNPQESLLLPQAGPCLGRGEKVYSRERRNSRAGVRATR